MKIQNIFRTQAIVIGFGAALLLASSAPAQEIVNTEFNDGPNVTAFTQPAPSAPTATSSSASADSNAAAASPAAISTAVVTSEAVTSFETSAEGWLIATVFFGITMLVAYAVAELRRANRDLKAHKGYPLSSQDVLS
jgi:hypothetical protein